MRRSRLILAAAIGVAFMNSSSAQINKEENTMIRFSTNHGSIDIEVFEDQAPMSAKNFISYVNEGFYDGTIFHRVIPGFVIQGGGFEPEMKQRATHAPIENEADNGLKNDRGTLSMARTSDPHSASSQFFVNLKDNDFLNHTGKNSRGWGYAVFARVVNGMDVVDKIAAVPTGNVGVYSDVPKQDVVITKAEILTD